MKTKPVCLGAGVIFLASSIAAIAAEVRVVNDKNHAFEVTLKPAVGLPQTKVIQKGQADSFNIGVDPHEIETKPVNGITLVRTTRTLEETRELRMKLLRTQVESVGNTPFGVIYDDMPGYRSTVRESNFYQDLQQTRWEGKNGWLRFDGDQGTANSGRDRHDTELQNIQYVPGSPIVIIAEWLHEGAEGQILLKVDSETKSLTGYWRYKGRNKNWQSGGTASLVRRGQR